MNYRSGLSKLFGRGSTKKVEVPAPEESGDKPPAAASSQTNERGPSGDWEILEPIKSTPEVAKKPPPVASKPKPGAAGGEEGKTEHTSPRKMPGMVAALPVNQELASVLKGVALKQATVKVCILICNLVRMS